MCPQRLDPKRGISPVTIGTPSMHLPSAWIPQASNLEGTVAAARLGVEDDAVNSLMTWHPSMAESAAKAMSPKLVYIFATVIALVHGVADIMVFQPSDPRQPLLCCYSSRSQEKI